MVTFGSCCFQKYIDPLTPNQLFETLSQRFDRFQLYEKVDENEELYLELIRLATSSHDPQGWRAAWVLHHTTKKNDPRLKAHIDTIIEALDNNIDGQQRELIRVLMDQDLDEDQEGKFYEKCERIWEKVGKSPSVRHTAFRIMAAIAKKYPELINELKVLTEEPYLDTLSPGIKSSVIKACNRLW